MRYICTSITLLAPICANHYSFRLATRYTHVRAWILYHHTFLDTQARHIPPPPVAHQASSSTPILAALFAASETSLSRLSATTAWFPWNSARLGVSMDEWAFPSFHLTYVNTQKLRFLEELDISGHRILALTQFCALIIVVPVPAST